MKSIVISSSSQKKCGVKLADDFSDLMRDAIHIVDSGILRRIGPYLPESYHAIQGGEQAKSVDHVFELYQLFKTTESHSVCGIGGGSLMELVGFAASTHSKVREFSFFPTTAVSQCMPPIGGQFRINFEFVKNVLRASGMPAKVVVLPLLSYDNLCKNGISEFLAPIVVSMSFDKRLFSYLKNVSSDGKLDQDTWNDIIWASLRAYVKGTETSGRVVGESMAETIQSSLRLQINYPVALAFGAVLEIWLASSMNLIPEQSAQEYTNSIFSIWNRTWPSRMDMSSLTDYIGQQDYCDFAYPCESMTKTHKVTSKEFRRMIRGTPAGRMESFT